MRFGIDGVPKYCDGRAIGPPAPRSASLVSIVGASKGAKKSAALSVLSGCTSTRTTDWPRPDGGWLPGVGDEGLPPPNALPVAKKREPDRSDTRPAPDIPMPAPQLVESAARAPERNQVARGGDSRDPALVGSGVAVSAEPGVDHAVHQEERGPLVLLRGVERLKRRVLRGSLDGDGKAASLASGREIDRVHLPDGGPGGARGVA